MKRKEKAEDEANDKSTKAAANGWNGYNEIKIKALSFEINYACGWIKVTFPIIELLITGYELEPLTYLA